MSDLREIYQDVILDHYRKPRNFAQLAGASHHAGGHNPLCGDRVEIFLQVEDGRVREATFKGNGCAISTASASMMTEAVKGKKVEEVHHLFDQFHSMLTEPESESTHDDLGKLEALSGVRQLPVRIKCATLAWHTLEAALANATANATTNATTNATAETPAVSTE